MKCDLCHSEKALAGHQLCVPCAEMVQRLIVVKERMNNLEAAEQSHTLNLSAAAAGSQR